MRNGLTLTLLGLMVASVADAQSAAGWDRTLERISSAVISIRVDSTRAFDTDWNSSSQATGFVVDAERGLVVTNRHVVTPGPVTAEAVFRNNEEVALTPVYRDPVHDFGLFRYDPDALRYIEPNELELHPAGAVTGREIRVVGNDAGEQLSILAGTIARLDRKAPVYGRGKYNDFNTFYYQAASGTSGGSSGSPVIDIEGRVVALNAGASSEAASSFFLPLDRVKRAVDLIREGRPIPRGTLQTIFVVKPYDELHRLGLTDASEARAREQHPTRTGMLVVQELIVDSPADLKLEPGDILVGLEGRLVTDFSELAEVLDSNVGEEISVEVERGGVSMTHVITVSDLHAITPDAFLQFGDAIVHDLSYQQARHYNRPLSGVYVANPGYIFSNAALPRSSVITEFNGVPIDTLDDMNEVIDTLADGQKVAVRFITLEAPQTETLRIVRMDRRWFPAQRCHRDDTSGYWPCTALAEGPEPEPPVGGSTRFVSGDEPIEKALAPSLVLVNFDMPYTVSGVAERHYYGTGLVVDAERGFVVVDRNTVPIAMGDVTITFAGSVEIPGRVVYVHPLHNLAMVAYDPALIGATPVQAARFDTRTLAAGEPVWVAGLRGDHRLVHQQTQVASVEPIMLPLTRTMRFRDSNLETISVVNAPEHIDGVLAGARGRVLALWSSFALQAGGAVNQINRGVPADLIVEFVDTVRSNRPIHSLETELAYAPLASARKLGLPEAWAEKLERHNPRRRQVLAVQRLVGGSPAAELLRPGDLILSIDGRIVSTFRELERATQSESVVVSVWRNREQVDVSVETVSLDGSGIERALVWAGALLQEPHRSVAAQRGIAPTGAYVAYFSYGSPATRYQLWGGRRIIEVDGEPTPDLDAFIAAVRDKQHRESVRLKTVNFNDATEVITLKIDDLYWPAYEIVRADDGWTRRDIGS